MTENPFDQVKLPEVEHFEDLQDELEKTRPSKERLEEMLAEADKAIASSNLTGSLADVVTTFRARVSAALKILTGGDA